MARRGQSASLWIGQARTSSAQVLFEDAVLFPQVFDHLKLVAIHPPSQGHEEDPPSDGVEHAPSLQAGRPLYRFDGSAKFSDSTGITDDLGREWIAVIAGGPASHWPTLPARAST